MTLHVKEHRRKRSRAVSEFPESPASGPPATPSRGMEGGASRPKKRRSEMRRGEEREEETSVTVETNVTESRKKKKKKKKKHRPAEEAVSTVTADQNNAEEETRQEVPASQELEEEEKKKKKKKKKKSEKAKKRREEREGVEPWARGEESGGGEEGEVSVMSTGSQHTSHAAVMQDFQEEQGGIRELEEFIPDVRSRAPYEVNKMLKYDLPRFKEFKRKGVAVRWGRFTAKENQQIRRNIEDFLVLTGISSTSMLFFPERFGASAADIKNLRVKHRFLERIADGIPRPCQNVFMRASKTYNNLNYMGRFSEQETESLKKLHTRYGNNWKKISQKMDRSVQSLEKRYSQLASNHGPWTSDELSRLLEGVRTHVEGLLTRPEGGGTGDSDSWVSREQLSNNLPWNDISKLVKTRSWLQCRKKWLTILQVKISAGGRPVFSSGPRSLQAKIHLINMLYNMNVEDNADIDWEHVSHTIGNVTADYVQKAYLRLKITYVPNWFYLSYCEIIDFLFEKVAPQLKQKLLEASRREGQEEVQEEVQEENRKRYLVSDIFSQEEQGFREIDNAHLDVGQLDDMSLD